jgi:hypothetical protein
MRKLFALTRLHILAKISNSLGIGLRPHLMDCWQIKDFAFALRHMNCHVLSRYIASIVQRRQYTMIWRRSWTFVQGLSYATQVNSATSEVICFLCHTLIFTLHQYHGRGAIADGAWDPV